MTGTASSPFLTTFPEGKFISNAEVANSNTWSTRRSILMGTESLRWVKLETPCKMVTMKPLTGNAAG